MSYADRYIESMSSDEMLQNDPTDVYSIIKSWEIREFFKNHIKLDVFEREQIILKSFISMQQKINMIKELALHGIERETAVLNEHCSIFEKCMTDIFHPVIRSIFIFECAEVSFEDYYITEYKHIVGAFDTMEELLCEVKTRLKGIETKAYGYITLLQIPQSEKNKNLFDFTIYWIDGCWQVKDIMMDKKDMRRCGVSEETIEQLADYVFEHFPLPFENRSRLKLQTPFMEEPFYGILDSGCGYPGEWHHYLWDEKIMAAAENVEGLYTGEHMKSCVPLSYLKLSLDGDYSTLDWVERV